MIPGSGIGVRRMRSRTTVRLLIWSNETSRHSQLLGYLAGARGYLSPPDAEQIANLIEGLVRRGGRVHAATGAPDVPASEWCRRSCSDGAVPAPEYRRVTLRDHCVAGLASKRVQ